MTKMIKMSLIAAVAVTGMTSTVCAQPLEEAIKGVDVSGMLRYRYDDLAKESTTAGTTVSDSTQYNEYVMKIATKAKVNDMVTANVQVEALGVNAGAQGYESAHTTTDQTGDRDVNLVVTKANFSANLGFATVIAGKQSVPSPFVDNSSDDVTRGTGAVALIPAGAVTVAAGHFVNFQKAEVDTSAAAGNYSSSISALAVLGKVADVNFDAWYVKVGSAGSAADTAITSHAGADAISIGVKAAVAGVNVDARYSKVSPDAANSTDGQLTKVIASTKVGGATVVAGFAMTNDKNSGVALDGDNDSQSGLRLWQADLNDKKDATAFLIGAGMEVMPSLTVDAKYLTVSAKDGVPSATVKDLDATELLIGVTYAMSKNFGVHARYSMYEADFANTATTDVEQSRGRLEVKYTF